jgi:hypothetical protein
MKLQGEARQQNLAKAQQNIQSMLQLYPALGGEHWRGEFDILLKKIQTAAGQKPIGLSQISARHLSPERR